MTRDAQPPTEPTADRGRCRKCGGPTLPPGREPDAHRSTPVECATCLWGPLPARPTAERAGDADDTATVLAELRAMRPSTDVNRLSLGRDEREDELTRLAYRRAINDVCERLAARPAAVPDRDENLRAALRSLADEWETTAGGYVDPSDGPIFYARALRRHAARLRAVLAADTGATT